MEHISGLKKLENTCAAYGSFDSMHRGHLKIAQTVKETAEKEGLQAVVLSQCGQKQVLTTEKEKAFYLEKEGIDLMVSAEAMEFSLEEFVTEILAGKLGVKVLVLGENHKHLADVQKAAEEAGIRTVVVETVRDDGEAITPERVRKAFMESDFETVTALCGHPYIMMGEVVHGKALGRTVGMPTANIGVPPEKMKPVSGVYATLGNVIGGTYQSLTNIGKRPSVDNNDYITIEAFILDFKQDIYGEQFQLEVHKFIRGVQRFDSLEEVQQQVQKDLKSVRDFLDNLTKKK